MQGRLYGLDRAAAEQRAAGAARRDGARRGRRPRDRRLLGRPAAPARRRASAWSTSRGLLFLDEPTTGLDPQARARMWDEVRALRDTGTTVFLTTHYLDEADALCDRLAIIDHGRIVAEGTADRAQARDRRRRRHDRGRRHRASSSRGCWSSSRSCARHRRATASSALYVDDGEASLPAVLRLLDGAGLAPQALALHRPSPRRRLPPPDRPLAAGRGGMTAAATDLTARLDPERTTSRCASSPTPGSCSAARSA